MKQLKQKIVTLLAALVLATSVQAGGVTQADPTLMVKGMAEQLLVEMEAQRSQLEGNPELISAFADAYVFPYVDAAKMARYVMARYWKASSPEQQASFVSLFSQTLMYSYSNSLLKLHITKVDVKPAKIAKKGRAEVPSEVLQADGNVTKISYRAYFNKKTDKWMLYDVSIEGISMLLNYRKSYAYAFKSKGVDKVIAEMAKKLEAYKAVKK